jgi:SAM-dependent methyltransferase
MVLGEIIRKIMLKFNYQFMKCPLCGRPPSPWIELFHILLNDNHKRIMDEEAMDYVMCKCGMAFVERYFDEEQARLFYEQGDYRYSTAVGSREVEPANINEETQRANAIMPVITKYLPNCSSALDVGCSTGILLTRIREQYKCEAIGIEQSERFRKFVIDKQSIACIDDIHKFVEPNYTFDLITAIHVLEHLIDPMAMLREIVKRLAPGGLFVCEVPVLFPILGHPMLFTMLSLSMMLGMAGFNDVKFENSMYLTAVARIGETIDANH